MYPRKVTANATNSSAKAATEVIPLVFQLTIAEGVGEKHLNLSHPLAAPMRRSASTGKPNGAWHYLCARFSNEKPPTVLGALAISPNNRTLFFPGADISFGNSDALDRFAGKSLDHFTLDPPNDGKWRSHATLREGGKRNRHGMSNEANDRDGVMLPWLSMLMPDLSGFHSLPKTLKDSLDWPRSDVARYAEEAIGNHYRQCAIVDAPPEPEGEGFWQVDFLVGQGNDWRNRKHGPVRYQDVDKFLTYVDPMEKRVGGTVISELTTGLGMVVIVTRPRGSLSQSLFITPPEERFEKSP